VQGDWVLSVLDAAPADVGRILSWSLAFEGSSAAPFTDPVLAVGVAPIRIVHVTELRSRINAVRARYSLDPFVWTDTTLVPGQTAIRASHIMEMRDALEGAYIAAGRILPVYTDTILTSRNSTIRASHVTELRNAVIALE